MTKVYTVQHLRWRCTLWNT